MQGRTRFSLGYYLLVFAAIFGLQTFFFSGPGVEQIPYSDFLERVKRDRVEEVVITDESIVGVMKSEEKPGKPASPT